MRSILPSPRCPHAFCSKERKDWGRIQFGMMKQSRSGCGLILIPIQVCEFRRRPYFLRRAVCFLYGDCSCSRVWIFQLDNCSHSGRGLLAQGNFSLLPERCLVMIIPVFLEPRRNAGSGVLGGTDLRWNTVKVNTCSDT